MTGTAVAKWGFLRQPATWSARPMMLAVFTPPAERRPGPDCENQLTLLIDREPSSFS
jgi:hypothetical protein